MNDLPVTLPDISITMYADDTEIGRSFTSVTEITGLTNYIRALRLLLILCVFIMLKLRESNT